MTRVQWAALTVPGGTSVDVVADNNGTTTTLSIEDPGDVPGGAPALVHGPFRINFDSTGITTDGYALPTGALGANVLVLGVYLKGITPWNSGTSEEIQFYVADAENFEAGDAMVTYDGRLNFGTTGALLPPKITEAGFVTNVPSLTTEELQYITAFITETGAPATAGAADAYVLVATFVS